AQRCEAASGTVCRSSHSILTNLGSWIGVDSAQELIPMTETEWHTSTDPCSMLRFLGTTATMRKLRLLACAYCRRLWARLTLRERRMVTIAEQFADGKGRRGDLLAGRSRSQPTPWGSNGSLPLWVATWPPESTPTDRYPANCWFSTSLLEE